ncbi:MAG: glycosyltransferase family 2 protein [Phycisphaerales bacterium]
MINDDILPEPGFVEAHVLAHAEREDAGLGEAMVLGHSPWVVPEDASLFDRLLAQSSMVFFYDRMITPEGVVLGERDRDWGFRHAWNLNLSVSSALAREVGGFCPAIANCCYEDLEFAWRVNRAREGGVPVLFRPEAIAPHDHRYTPEGFLERERRLGYSAFGFAKASPECAGMSSGWRSMGWTSWRTPRGFSVTRGGPRSDCVVRSGGWRRSRRLWFRRVKPA